MWFIINRQKKGFLQSVNLQSADTGWARQPWRRIIKTLYLRVIIINIGGSRVLGPGAGPGNMNIERRAWRSWDTADMLLLDGGVS